MTIGLTEEQAALASSLADWADDRGFPAAVRRAEGDGPGVLLEAWGGLADLGVLGIGVPESLGGAGGTLLDLACALEAASAGLVPGPLLSTATAATLLGEQVGSPVAKRFLPAICDGSARVGLAAQVAGAGQPSPLTVSDEGARLSGEVPVVLDLANATHLLLGGAAGLGAPTGTETWFVVPTDAEGVTVETSTHAPDLSRTVGSVRLADVAVSPDETFEVGAGRVHDVLLALAAAEASGTARWALHTAVQYAGVREQFGRKIGSFQAIKHLCAQMLERAESATAVAWDAASARDGDPRQLRFASAVAAATALDAAVENAKDCIQVLGGIGFTWEHDAHLHLRRALSTRQLLGGTDRLRLVVAGLALDGVRRTPVIALGDGAEELRASVRADVERVRNAEGAARRTALAESGLLAPHWPRPYGRGADPREQLVIDEELASADVRRPDLGIGAWASPTILGHGTEAQKERFVPGTLRGDIVWCQLFSEPGAGSDLASLRTRAERVEGGWRLTGQKVWTSLATRADWGICLARTNPEAPSHKGITYFLVDMRTPGIDVRPLRQINGVAHFNEVFLSDVRIPAENVVGEVNGGWGVTQTTLANERTLIGGGGSGLGFGDFKRLARECGVNTDPVLRQRLVDAFIRFEIIKYLGARAQAAIRQGRMPGPESSVLKLAMSQHVAHNGDLALALQGAAGMLIGEDATQAGLWQQQFLGQWGIRIGGGTEQIQPNVIGERVLGLPGEARPDKTLPFRDLLTG